MQIWKDVVIRGLLRKVAKVSITRNFAEIWALNLLYSYNLQGEVHADAIKKHNRYFRRVRIKCWPFSDTSPNTYLELEHFRSPKSVDRANYRLSISVSDTLMPIHQ